MNCNLKREESGSIILIKKVLQRIDEHRFAHRSLGGLRRERKHAPEDLRTPKQRPQVFNSFSHFSVDLPFEARFW